MAEATATEEQAPPQEEASVQVSEAQLPEAEANRVKSPGGQLDILLDTMMKVSVRLGHAEMPARELVQLGPGSVVTLDKRAGEPVELLLRGIPFALGKLVIVSEQLGVKIEEILSPEAEHG
jgi:flagellar motor switch protein FliN/FliY